MVTWNHDHFSYNLEFSYLKTVSVTGRISFAKQEG